MKQLGGLDELFFAMERPNQCMHVAVLGIYDPSTAPGGKVRLRDIMAHIRERLDVSPVLRRRLVRVPFDLDRAYWIDEAEVDLEYHIRHIALPKPGDWRHLCIQVARLHSLVLDRNKPLWQAYVIEGIDNVEGVKPGSFAIYIKFHRAEVDGEASAQILRALHSLISMPEHSYVPRKPIFADAVPTLVELYARSVGNAVPRVVRLWHTVSAATLKMTSLAGKVLYQRVAGGSLRDRLLEQLAWPKEPVKTRFAGSVSSRRIVEGVGFDMARVQRVRKWVSGATTNDVFMATVGGAVRRYLQECGDSLEAGLSAAVPASHQDILPGSDRGNKLNQHRVPLHVEIESGLARLRAIRQSAGDTRQTADVIGHDLLRQLADELPTRITSAVVDSLLGDYLNIVVSTVRGPDVPLYLAGAQLNRFYPIGVVKNGVGLNITGFSYCGNLWATVVSCRKMIPDPDVFANCLRQSFEALVAEVDREELGKRATAEAVSQPRASKRRMAAPAVSQPDPGQAPHHPVRARLATKTAPYRETH
ncbi:MAG: wax ester/triacylglycerol synthase family O-acyltransferase [Azonexus sp.]|jgi:WS/DGAT/MGAT family acyltransferase